jgi:hypothetical protein
MPNNFENVFITCSNSVNESIEVYQKKFHIKLTSSINVHSVRRNIYTNDQYDLIDSLFF